MDGDTAMLTYGVHIQCIVLLEYVEFTGKAGSERTV